MWKRVGLLFSSHTAQGWKPGTGKTCASYGAEGFILVRADILGPKSSFSTIIPNVLGLQQTPNVLTRHDDPSVYTKE